MVSQAVDSDIKTLKEDSLIISKVSSFSACCTYVALEVTLFNMKYSIHLRLYIRFHFYSVDPIYIDGSKL